MIVRLLILPVFLCLLSCSEPDQKLVPLAEKTSALDSLNALLVEQAQNKELYLERAKLLYQNANDLQSAFEDLDRVYKLDSMDFRSFYYRALWNFEQKKVQLAHDQAFRALDKNPDHIESFLLLSKIYFLVQNYEESILKADEVLKRDLYHSEAYFLKGMSFKEAGDTAKAVSSFLTATEQNPDYYEAWMELGLLFGSVANPNTAAYYDNALRIDPNSLEALYNQALFFQDSKQVSNALANYRRMLAIDSLDTRAYYNSGYVHLVYLENFDSANYYFNRVIVLDPQDADAIYNKALSLELSSRLDSAVLYYRKTLKVVPNHDMAARALQRILG